LVLEQQGAAVDFTVSIGFVVLGLLLIGMALTGSIVSRIPLSAAMLYVVGGILLGPAALGVIDLDPIEDAALLERVAEIAIIISLFTAGLKLRVPLRDKQWHLSLRLAFISMSISVGLVALAGVAGLGLPLGAAILLGAILAPTDPVLASDVQVREPGERDRLRFSLTSEAGLNDGTAFPFVMLGLGLLGLHKLGDGGWRWLTVDVAWAIVSGLAIGALLGTLVGRLVIYLRQTHREAVGLDDFLALGLIALSYGGALLAHGYGFLAVFAAGLAVRRIEATASTSNPRSTPIPELAPQEVQAAIVAGNDDIATHPDKAPAFMTAAVLAFNEQIDRIGALGMVVLVGSMLSTAFFSRDVIWFVPLLLLVIRPASVWAGLFGSHTDSQQRHYISWFGVRGIGSIYYLMFAIEHGLEQQHAETFVALTLSVITVSVIVHGVSVTPMMKRYEAGRDGKDRQTSRNPPRWTVRRPTRPKSGRA
jgi:sodium/hydrogen antiporter